MVLLNDLAEKTVLTGRLDRRWPRRPWLATPGHCAHEWIASALHSASALAKATGVTTKPMIRKEGSQRFMALLLP